MESVTSKPSPRSCAAERVRVACTLAALPLGRALGDSLAGKLLGRFALPLSGLLLAGLGVWELLA